ncbi:hypothetical protein HW130_04740 [Streptomyces sp. PKU-EA00015]|uniref:hypothetical protein n=1 Tax=Streptomyces sp. PKU-EA00015 TaxID=2748326 RepID=UPI0015A3FF58|nr:hypothetical protein [Streptomyces sp. PKU-EA00015]NWF25576.1 hypothetical protein [Streptomyces sp. PKU-EA00015]
MTRVPRPLAVLRPPHGVRRRVGVWGSRLDTSGELIASRDLDDWQVCRQQPEPDTEVSAGTQVDLWLIALGDPEAAPAAGPVSSSGRTAPPWAPPRRPSTGGP